MKCLIMSCVIFCGEQDATGGKEKTQRERGKGWDGGVGVVVLQREQ